MKRKFGLLHHAVLISCRLASSKKKANHFIFEKFKSSTSVSLLFFFVEKVVVYHFIKEN